MGIVERSERLASRMELLVAADVNRRGSRDLLVPGDLLAAARSLFAGEGAAIVTGFYIPQAGAPETDGPPGALALARALARLGKRVVLMADRFCLPLLLHPAMEPWTAGLTVAEAAPDTGPDWLKGRGVTHVVAVERVGRAEDGHYYDARGRMLDPYAPPVDRWMWPEPDQGLVTVGIGDGGNEIGMGKVRHRVRNHAPQGSRIACVVPANFLISAGVSNWGAYALIGMLSELSGIDLLPTPGEEAAVLRALVAAGAVDGLSGLQTPTVDGQSPAVLAEMLGKLGRLAGGALRAG
ncbi:MAG: DUF4392 domain-containing protein [Firmicutes bacterium]|nr:DUF4392 domain-containing protein [Bacillota bacterium]